MATKKKKKNTNRENKEEEMNPKKKKNEEATGLLPSLWRCPCLLGVCMADYGGEGWESHDLRPHFLFSSQLEGAIVQVGFRICRFFSLQFVVFLSCFFFFFNGYTWYYVYLCLDKKIIIIQLN